MTDNANVSFFTDRMIRIKRSNPTGLSDRIKPYSLIVSTEIRTIRAPNHDVAQELLLKFGKPLVAPSANPFGKISPTTAHHVQHAFPTNDFLILDGGRCSVGVESTIVSALDSLTYEIARPGIIDEEKIAATTSLKGLSLTKNTRVPGGLSTHYQPEKKLYYVDDIGQASPWLDTVKASPYVLTFSQNYRGPYVSFYEFPDSSEDAAYELYYRLRIADQSEADFILTELPPKGEAWLVIREKIVKAGRPMRLMEER